MVRKLSFGTAYVDGKPIDVGANCYFNQRIYIGQSENGKKINWVLQDGKLIADRVLLRRIFWNQLINNDLVFGGTPILLDGQMFRCRILKIGPNGDEWSKALQVKEMLVWASEKERFFWVLETDEKTHRLGRRNSFRPIMGPEDERPEDWLPVLEPMDPNYTALAKDNYLDICSDEHILSGWLEDQTDYDLLIRPDPGKYIPIDLDRKVFSLEDDMFLVNKSGIRIVRKTDSPKKGGGVICTAS